MVNSLPVLPQNDSKCSKTLVVGAGSWGTALAILLARNRVPTLLWARDSAQVAAMVRTRQNDHYLPQVSFPPSLEPVADLEAALPQTEQVLVVVPSHGFRSVLERLAGHLPDGVPLSWATKGLEPGTGRLLHEVAAEVLGPGWPMAVVSGPTFAHEVAAGLPTAVTVAATESAVATRLASCLHGETFRVYTSDDLIGVQLGGAVKNVLAIAAGIGDGLGFGANTRAALITRGLAELMRFALAYGAQRETLMGLSGLGDLVLTCTDNQSRNRRLGLALAQGKRLDEALALIGQAVEGAAAAKVVVAKAKQLNVEMPIAEQIYQVLYAGRAPRQAVEALCSREQKPEYV
ncbi:NAD(P)H-dependent glycerol-3-phosphate dehydrogenase [Nitrosococcus wardiae]|uniref:Glycerol-3-phosphate dehydrogenase [NAD(P)+] n=1 Tax=Nitrosococcus wardiae TaxID=1814290 RepID=A0A4P7BXC6_9GAMM|nr:NAD(P)H-dependent glycerol-3-phosphate dehydrogenase [Nitrosococcus wardiae]QBQ53760.1 NAD(P)-dependent glycerol-3-phosphate dehydrogenase [Nitrosococcus wardiae]